MKDKWNIVGYPGHLCYYTKGSIKKLFNKNGFKPKSISTTGISFTRYKTSKSNLKNKEKYISEKSDDEVIRVKIESNYFFITIKKIINFCLSILGKGDTIKCYFVKS